MRILNRDAVRAALPMDAAIRAMKDAYAALSSGRAVMPLRANLSITPHAGTALVMPAYVGTEAGDALAVKVVTLFDRNRDRGLPFIHAAVLALEPDTGRVAAVIEGAALTALRTGAASGAATDLLARPESRIVAILGSGVQARTQLEAVCTVRSIEEVRVFSPHPENASAFAREVAGVGPVPRSVRAVASPVEAVRGADIICAASTSATPVFDDPDVPAGAHINAIGSFQPHVQEIPGATVARALLVVDQRRAALDEAGDLIRPIEEGLITAGHVHAELGEVVLGRRPGRTDPEQVTLFESVGLAVQDAMAARVLLENAARAGIGEDVAW